MKKIIRNFFCGLAFGLTETVPGVSGGTIAIILGFYNELIETINHIKKEPKKYLKFAVPLFFGMAAGILLFGSLINYLLNNFSLPTMFFFIGLITGIIPLIFLKVKEHGKKINLKEIALAAAPFALLVVISNMKATTVADPAEIIREFKAPYMLFIFFAGALAAAALIIPGVSGSFTLLLLGIYPLVTHSISSVFVFLSDMSNVGLFAEICKVLVPLAIGILIGVLLMARLVERLLKNHHKTVYSIIFGLLSGSVYALFRDPIVYRSGAGFYMVAAGVLTFLIGCVTSYFIGKKKL